MSFNGGLLCFKLYVIAKTYYSATRNSAFNGRNSAF